MSLLDDAARRAQNYLASLPRRPVVPSAEAVARLSAWDEPLPDHPTDAAETLRLLDEVGSPATMAMAGPRFFGFVIGGALPATVAAQWLATAWDQNTGLDETTPGTSRLERIALGWLLDVLGLPPDSAGSFVTGATMANFTGLAAARHGVLARAGWDVNAQGLQGSPPLTVVIGAEAHPTLIKSLGLLGLGRGRATVVDVDRQGRMRADRFPSLRGPSIVCIQAGNVNTGGFDPAAEIVARAHEAGAWVHVDGAFGLWAAASPALRAHVKGVAEADSWATDAHKWLNVPYDCGLAFVRDAAALRNTMAIHASYLPKADTRDPSDFTPELSRRARGVEVWTALRTLGRSGLAEMLERTCRHARRFARGLEAAGYEVLNEVVLNQVLVSFGDPAATERVIAALQADGTCWCGGTSWQGRTAMRISVSSWATTDDDVEQSLAAMLKIAKDVAARQAVDR
jgi:glutamate/tyrosine decarboxylase-like PLP-dependent enzyme